MDYAPYRTDLMSDTMMHRVTMPKPTRQSFGARRLFCMCMTFWRGRMMGAQSVLTRVCIIK